VTGVQTCALPILASPLLLLYKLNLKDAMIYFKFILY